jgi:hypothetical protein
MARRRGPKKEKPPKVEWERVLLVEKALAELVHQAHPNLERAKIVAIGKPGKAGESRCHGIVKLRVLSSAEKAMVKEDLGDVAYVVEVRTAPYETLSAEQKKRRLDHALCHAFGQDERGRWIRTGHDVEEFKAILERHGAPDDNPQFMPVAKQMALFAKGK